MTDHRAFYDHRAHLRGRECARAYHGFLHRCYSFLVPPGSRALELGCGPGDLLAAVKPARDDWMLVCRAGRACLRVGAWSR